MVSKKSRSEVRVNKHRKLRNRFSGTAERPRLAVFRSNNHMYAQIIDDTVGNTLVSASTLQKDVKAELEKTNNVAAAAYLGVPYVWGGTSGSGVDCSGLVYLAHQACGIPITRNSYSQGSGGQAVSDPQPGDVVCYGGHVGIYAGGGQMIHAPQPGEVVCYTSVNYAYHWYRRYW